MEQLTDKLNNIFVMMTWICIHDIVRVKNDTPLRYATIKTLALIYWAVSRLELLIMKMISHRKS